ESGLEIEAARQPGGPNARLSGAEMEVVGNIADALDAGGAETLEPLAVQAGKPADDPVHRLGGRAMRPELAVVGIEAVRRRLRGRCDALRDPPPELPHPRRDVRQ